MLEYRCKDCGVFWYGWGAKEKPICKKCGGKLEPVLEDNADKKQASSPLAKPQKKEGEKER